MKPDISVIIPNYNCKAYLGKALASVIKQTDVILEIIVVDDGSTDGSVEWLEKASQTYSNLILVKQIRCGVVAARNKAISIAQADYIAFLDADDYWNEDKLATQLAYMKSNQKCTLSFTNYMHVDEQYNKIIDCFSYWPEFYNKELKDTTKYQYLSNSQDMLLYANVIGTSTVMVKRDAIKSVMCFDNELKSASDWDCWLKLASVGEVAYTYQCAMDYLMRSNSITSNRIKRIDAMRLILKRFVSSNNVGWITQIKAGARLNECYGEYYREMGQKVPALIWALKAFFLYPHKRNLRHLLHDIKSLTA
ncbi:glycosyltransferase family 2 protein [Pseudoalteromonas sp. MMG012]|uniref:glycosyltransferase family 2 protein n=1 Tax=Pseudoalteromonas sp. MMG012 TaxID=2822686 RepID=UPI001B3A0EA4|nr:glycosyltransferase family 2 protein [Pseudoalteromonas sp. MMG012]MBQ4851566.1 glycosyltransferase family 2 protein [Pseudoalteromonas sp. MMG012]